MPKDSMLRSLDWTTVVIYLLLIAVGWVSICGACYDFDHTNLLSWDLQTGKQLVWIGGALLLCVVILMLDTRLFEDFAIPIYLIMLLLLVVTIFVSTNIKGSHSWLAFGSLRLQPAEFAKCATALALARVMSQYGFSLRNTRSALLCTGMVFLPLLIIIAQRETGSALVYMAFLLMFYREGMSGTVLYVCICAAAYFLLTIRFGATHVFHETTPLGVFIALSLAFVSVTVMTKLFLRKLKVRAVSVISLLVFHVGIFMSFFSVTAFNLNYLLIAILACWGLYFLYRWLMEKVIPYLLIGLFSLSSIVFVYSSDYLFGNVLEAHQQVRIRLLLGMEDDPSGAGYNVRQSLIAIGSGGMTGKGFLNGTQTKLKYVPEQSTDFIFCTIGEEEGFLGAAFVLLLFTILIMRIMKVAERGRTAFQRIYGYSVAAIFIFHIVINVGMVLGITPVIGIPLPFISYGGSSLWGFTLLLFILLRIDATRNQY